MGIFSRNKYIEKSQFTFIIESLVKSLEALREDFIYGSLTQLKREGVDVSMISKEISPGSELEDELKGFQLTSMIGIAWNYIKDPKEKIDFDDSLSRCMGAEEGTRGG